VDFVDFARVSGDWLAEYIKIQDNRTDLLDTLVADQIPYSSPSVGFGTLQTIPYAHSFFDLLFNFNIPICSHDCCDMSHLALAVHQLIYVVLPCLFLLLLSFYNIQYHPL
jgi:hypothetical protein